MYFIWVLTDMKKFFIAISLLLSLSLFWGINNFASAQNEVKGINTQSWCLTWMWKWCFDYEKLIFPGSRIDGVNERKSVLTVVQDVVLWATYMVWTVLMIIIVYCGVQYILAAREGKDPKSYQNWLKNAALWAILVRWWYAIVRLIQYIAKW